MLWRLPFGRGADPWPPIPDESRAAYAGLEPRFAVLDEVVMPAFVEHDRNAMRAQRDYRRFRLALIIGVALTSLFGAVQAAIGEAAWVGAILTILGLVTAGIANQQRRSQPLRRYLTERAKAEELRSLYFAFLSGDRDQRTLESETAAIRYSAPSVGSTP